MDTLVNYPPKNKLNKHVISIFSFISYLLECLDMFYNYWLLLNENGNDRVKIILVRVNFPSLSKADGPPHMAKQKQDDQLEPTYSS